MKWQPIETAPKDGTEVLTYREANLMSVAFYYAPDDEWICADGPALDNVTHWMPLPEPPEDTL